MLDSSIEILTTPRQDDLGLVRIKNDGWVFDQPSCLIGAVFSLEHAHENRRDA